jgi:hypothetical protein
MAEDLIANLPGDILDEKDFVVEEVSQTGGSDAVILTRLNAAFRFQKVGGEWIAREVRVGNNQWESIDDLVASLRRIKEDRTKGFLDTVAGAVEKYCLKNGELPRFNNYDSLSDVLAPEYLNPLIRLDAWERPLHADRLNANAIRLVSAGADGELGSGDDIELTRTYTGK